MARIHYARVDEFWRKEEKYASLNQQQHGGNVAWQEIQPDAKHNWLTEGMRDDFQSFPAIGSRETKGRGSELTTIFVNYSRGTETTRDDWVYNFNSDALTKNVRRLCDRGRSR